jgi:hypothetical protein
MKAKSFRVLACLALVFSSCDSPVDVPSGSESPSVDTPDTPVSIPKSPKIVSPEKALALLRLDEHPVRDLEEVTVVVENFLSDAVNISGTASVQVITEITAHTITANSGFAVKSPDSDTETIPASSELPFYRYTLTDTATGTTGVLIASGDIQQARWEMTMSINIV